MGWWLVDMFLVDCVTRWYATHCNTLQHTATHCNTLQHTATHCNTLQHTATHCNTLNIHIEGVTRWSQYVLRQHTATHCNTLQHTATHYNTLQHPFNCAHYWLCDPFICFMSLRHRCDTTHSWHNSFTRTAYGIWSVIQISISDLNLIGLFSTGRDKRDQRIWDWRCRLWECLLHLMCEWWHTYDTHDMMTTL